MPASINSPADVVNLALRRIGYKLRVGSLLDGSMAASQALDIYAQTRDEVLRQNDWGFAERNVSLTVLKSAPAGGYIPPATWNPTNYPPLPWAFSYEYPSDCIKVRSVKQPPLFLFNPAPQPNLFEVANDNGSTPVRKVILANVPNAICVYTGQITNPAHWEADFVEAIAAALGRRLAPVLVGLNAVQLAGQDEAVSAKIAEMEQG